MEVQIISEELIKPSSPTPQDLKTFKLSLLGQLIPPPHTPVILFYDPNSEPEPCFDAPGILDQLRKSLPQILARFYPLAGKIRDGLHIECVNGGARFVEATVNMSLPQFLTDLDLILLNKLIPCEFTYDECRELAHAANIQVNVFQGGGIAIAICNTHKLHDAAAIRAFLMEWAAATQGGGDGDSHGSVAADEDLVAAAKLFPANDLWLRDTAKNIFTSMFKPGNCVTKRFLFRGPAIEALIAKGVGRNVKNPTRVEAISGFLWKCAVIASKRKNDGLGRPSTFTHMVNVRRRMNPPMSESSLGNLLWLAIAHWETTGSRCADDVLPSLVDKLREAISKIDGNLLLGLSQDKNIISSSLGKISGADSSDKADHILCSSWCKFGFYDVDFGWGRPIWVSNIGLLGPVFINLIFLIDTRSGDGIEAWVTLDEQEMDLMQEDPELRSFASVNPSPLSISSKP